MNKKHNLFEKKKPFLDAITMVDWFPGLESIYKTTARAVEATAMTFLIY